MKLEVKYREYIHTYSRISTKWARKSAMNTGNLHFRSQPRTKKQRMRVMTNKKQI